MFALEHDCTGNSWLLWMNDRTLVGIRKMDGVSHGGVARLVPQTLYLPGTGSELLVKRVIEARRQSSVQKMRGCEYRDINPNCVTCNPPKY